MKKNDILNGICVDYTHDGLGIVKSNDFTFFIRNVLKGETIEFVVTKLKKTYGYGKCLKVLQPSNERVEPYCPYYGKCGGCQLQHMSYQEQLQFKKDLVENNMRNIGGVEVPVLDTIGASLQIAYRNKAQFPVKIEDNVAMGFYRLHSNDIIDMSTCMIQSNLINEIMYFIKKMFIKYKVEDAFRHLLIKHAFHTNEAMVVFIVKKQEIQHLDEIVNRLTKQFSQIKSVIMNINTRNDNVILGEEEILLYGNERIYDMLSNLKFSISSKSFYQVNPRQTEILYETALNMANISEKDHVIDLYCGVGTISLFLAKKAKHVTGIEIVPSAIEDAKKNAQINGLSNVDFVCSDAGEYASYMAQNNVKADVIVVDPPRKGCDEKTLKAIHIMNPKRLVYVSCNPATLARDIKYMETLGYKAKVVQPVDMFPSSFHIENVCLMEKEV